MSMGGYVYPEASFQVNGFQAPVLSPGESGMGKWGIGIDLSAAFAKLAHDTAMDREVERRMQDIGTKIVHGFYPKEKKLFRSGLDYGYAFDGWLLRGLWVPGNCACLFATDCISDLRSHGLAAFEFGTPGRGGIRYIPHNVDSHLQASCMLSLWLRWYNAATAHLIKF